jgi:hypothetical protein
LEFKARIEEVEQNVISSIVGAHKKDKRGKVDAEKEVRKMQEILDKVVKLVIAYNA